MQPTNGMTGLARFARDRRGFTLIELLLVVAIIGILAAIGVSLYSSLEARARIGRAQADVRTISSAIQHYGAHMGVIPTTAEGLAPLAAEAVNPQGQSAGPFLAAIPTPPTGGAPAWPAVYVYQADVGAGGAPMPGSFVVCAAGDGVVAHTAAGSATCP